MCRRWRGSGTRRRGERNLEAAESLVEVLRRDRGVDRAPLRRRVKYMAQGALTTWLTSTEPRGSSDGDAAAGG